MGSTLFGGEKQRPAFARFLLHQSDIVVLDQATSALDPGSQHKLMELLTPSSITIVSVDHRPELEAFHSRKIVLERQRGGARFVTDITLIPRPGRRRLLRRWLRARPAPEKNHIPVGAAIRARERQDEYSAVNLHRRPIAPMAGGRTGASLRGRSYCRGARELRRV
jgi:energy-coupling factor transporter ATP-binding protein EcfA2